MNDAKQCKVSDNKNYYTGKGGEYSGIFLQDKCDKTTVYKNKISKFFDGITITDSNSLTVSSNTIKDSKRDGITCKGTNKSSFKNNKITNSKSQGMYFEKAKATVKNCTIDKVSEKHGIAINSKDCNLKITNCTIKFSSF